MNPPLLLFYTKSIYPKRVKYSTIILIYQHDFNQSTAQTVSTFENLKRCLSDEYVLYYAMHVYI